MPVQPPPPRKRLQIVAPPDAAVFSIYRVVNINGSGRQSKMRGEPDADGTVPDAWPVSEFSTAKVLANWGDGKYRVEWYNADGDRIKPGQLFEVAQPTPIAAKGRKLPPRHRSATGTDDSETLERAASQIGSGQGIGVLELMALLDARGEREAEKAAQQAERDRQFWAQMQSNQSQLLQSILQRPAAGAGGGAADSELLRRELRLEMDQRLFDMRRQFVEEGRAADPDDPDDPPKDINEAGERIGLRILGELEERAPEMIEYMIPALLDFFKKKGIQPSAETQERIRAAQNGHANRG